MKAYLQHGAWGGPYLTQAVDVKETETPRGRHRNATGYGKQLPTPYMVKWEGRWRRVYCVCYSNSGTLYIKADSDIVVQIERESAA